MTLLLTTFLFYLFGGITVASALGVISARNPVHSVLLLILAFFNTAALFVLLGAEYLAMTLVIVYVGAVAVLFLFVVMMLDINVTQLREGFLRHLPLGALTAGLLLLELGIVFFISLLAPHPLAEPQHAAPNPEKVSNTLALGRLLYTHYAYLFQLAGIILLVAMIGAIVLTLRHRPGVRRQNISRQVSRKREDSVAIVHVRPGEGIS